MTAGLLTVSGQVEKRLDLFQSDSQRLRALYKQQRSYRIRVIKPVPVGGA
jgi:hypothetical protein